jgi:hypothetical protein
MAMSQLNSAGRLTCHVPAEALLSAMYSGRNDSVGPNITKMKRLFSLGFF